MTDARDLLPDSGTPADHRSRLSTVGATAHSTKKAPARACNQVRNRPNSGCDVGFTAKNSYPGCSRSCRALLTNAVGRMRAQLVRLRNLAEGSTAPELSLPPPPHSVWVGRCQLHSQGRLAHRVRGRGSYSPRPRPADGTFARTFKAPTVARPRRSGHNARLGVPNMSVSLSVNPDILRNLLTSIRRG